MASPCSNRQLQVFIAYAQWFKPKYVLMENVQVRYSSTVLPSVPVRPCMPVSTPCVPTAAHRQSKTARVRLCALAATLPQDMVKKEDGAYLKYAMGSMLHMRYQVGGLVRP